MSYFSEMSYSDSASIDAFGRVRTSDPFTIFDSKCQYDKMELLWTEKVSGAGAASTYNTNQASVTLSVPVTTASSVIRQTKRRFNYQSGKSQLILITGVFGSGASGITKQVGYFDDKNGLFFQLAGTTLSIVKRTYTSGTAVDTVVAQSSWNIDKLDGTGRSGITLDVTKVQIIFIDIEWLGVGRVRMGFVIDGKVYYCHQFLHANVETLVYMSTPNLPIRYRIANDGTGAASTMTAICSSVISEGGREDTGLIMAADRVADSIASGNNTNIVPLVSIRLKSARLSTEVKPLNVSVFTTNAQPFRVGLYLNPTIASVDAASWVSAGANSSIEYDISRTASNTLSGGTLMASGYVSNQNRDIQMPLSNSILIGSDVDGVADQIVLAAQSVPANNNSYYGGITWIERI